MQTDENPALPSSEEEDRGDPEHAEESVSFSARHKPPIITKNTPTKESDDCKAWFTTGEDFGSWSFFVKGRLSRTDDREISRAPMLAFDPQPLADEQILSLVRGIVELGGTIAFECHDAARRIAFHERCVRLLGSDPEADSTAAGG